MTEESEFLLRSLEDLEAERAAGDIDPRDYEMLRDAYVARAAAALADGALANGAAVKGAAVSGAAVNGAAVNGATDPAGTSLPAPVRGRSGRVAVVLTVVVAFAAGAGVLLARNAGTRLPGDNVSGSTPGSPAAKLDAQAQLLIQKSDILGAIKAYDAALHLDPSNAEALAYKGWLIRLAGHQASNSALVDTGLTSIRQAEQVAPDYPDAHFFAGETLLRDKNDPQGAINEFQQYLADNPPQAMIAEVRLELQSAQMALQAPTTTTTPP